MPESFNEVHSLFAAILSGRAGEETVYSRKDGIQQRNQIIPQNGLDLGILSVLPIAVF